MHKILNKVLLVLPLIISVILWYTFSFKTGLLFYGLFSLGMYIHISITTLCNAFIGREINVSGDVFWKMLFLIIFCLTIALFLVI